MRLLAPELERLRVPTARVFLPLLGRARHKGAKGGRGSGKSHFCAEYVIEKCCYQHVRGAMLREFQTSIKDSVKQLLTDKINHWGLQKSFDVSETEIRGPNESLLIFKGLNTAATGAGTAKGIKSLEGYNLAWVEEAQTISQTSLNLLQPTFRTEGSELLYSWNPTRFTDPVDRFFRENTNPAEGVICVTANFRDNPWFPADLRADMERDRRRDPDKYKHVWLGEYESSSEIRVFKNWRIEEFDTPAGVTFYFGGDWGSIDPTVLIRCFIVGRQLFVDQEVYGTNIAIDYLPAFFAGSDVRPDVANPGDFLAARWANPFDYPGIVGSILNAIIADSARPEIISYMNARGFRIIPARKGPNSLEEGVDWLKNFDIIVHPRCVHTSDELTLYSHKVDPHTSLPTAEFEDKHNHVIDALRYATEARRRAPVAVMPYIAMQSHDFPAGNLG